MTNDQKALIYDECVREMDRLQRQNSKIKSEFVGNIPPDKQTVIEENNKKITFLINKIEGMMH